MRLPLVIIVLCFAPTLFGQWIVNDPVNTSVNLGIQSAQTANHLEVLKQWAVELEKLNRQIRQLEDQLTEQRRIREVLGSPSLAGSQLALNKLAPEEMARTYGETLQAIRRLADATMSLRRTADGIYAQLDDRTSLQQSFSRNSSVYRRYAAVDLQADSLGQVYNLTAARQTALQADLGSTLAALKTATTQAEVDKLNVKVAALNGQLALISDTRRDESAKLQAQQIQNENQAAKERQDFLEKQIAEERQTLEVVNRWQGAVQLTPDRYNQP